MAAYCKVALGKCTATADRPSSEEVQSRLLLSVTILGIDGTAPEGDAGSADKGRSVSRAVYTHHRCGVDYRSVAVPFLVGSTVEVAVMV